jgi:hypothetical protein
MDWVQLRKEYTDKLKAARIPWTYIKCREFLMQLAKRASV